MLSVYVLRFVPAEQAAGRVVGQVEDVASGGSHVIHSGEELVGFLAGGGPRQEEGICRQS